MYKGTFYGRKWQSVGLRKNGERAIMWSDGDIVWVSGAEFEIMKTVKK
jgi:hypothetical protein